MRLWFILCALAPFLLAGARLVKRSAIGCPERCDKSQCAPIPADCLAGDVLDRCDCCPVCASGEGEPCGGAGDGECAEGMECVVTGGVEVSATVRRRGSAGVCVCRSSEPVCGSDGVSYRNICELKRVSNRAMKLQQPPVIFIQRGACGKGEQRACERACLNLNPFFPWTIWPWFMTEGLNSGSTMWTLLVSVWAPVVLHLQRMTPNFSLFTSRWCQTGK